MKSMALGSKLRSVRLFSTTSPLNAFFKTPLTTKEKTHSLLSLIRFEKNPDRIIDACRSTALSPESHSDRIAYSKVVSRLRELNSGEGIRSFIKESFNQLDTKSERVAAHYIVLYGHGGLVNDAVKLFDEMPSMGFEINVKTLNSLLFSCCLAGEYAEMKRVFSEFPNKYGLDPNLDTYNIVLKGFCDSGSANKAHSILAEMQRKSIRPDRTTFGIVIAGFYKEEDYNSVGKMMELMKKYDIQSGISIYNIRIQSLCKLKKSAEAKALFDSILSRGMKPDSMTYSHLIYGFCREGKLDVVKSLFEDMVERELKPSSQCYFTLVYYFCRGRDFEAALYYCDECISSGWVPNITTMKSLVDGLVSINKVKEASRIIKQLKKKFSRNADIWREIEEKIDE